MPMQPEPSYDDYYKRWAEAYDNSNYEKGLAATLMKRGHALLEKRFPAGSYCESVVEVGAGSGAHFPFVQHGYGQYVMTDASDLILDKARKATVAPAKGQVIFQRENAAQLSFSDASFDRLIAAHVLEHMPNPHEVLREWARVVKPGGVLSLLLPCDPGMLWRLGRHFGPRSAAEKAGIAYDYWMAREHINSINNLISLIRYYFDDVDEGWFPLPVPSIDLNLFYTCHIRV